MATHISRRETQFNCFDQLLDRPAWKSSTILDFGGNVGGFLVGAGDNVEHDNYWCLDVTHKAIEIGRRHFPRAHFVHYDRYSSYFNPNGVRNLPVPDLGLKFDIVLAFSVFTHTHQKEMLDLVEQLRRMLTPRGVLAFTFSDPRYDRSLADPRQRSGAAVPAMCVRQHAWKPRVGGPAVITRLPGWGVEIDGALHIEPGDELCQQQRQGRYGESYCSYFAADYLASLFQGARVMPPVSPDWQHCCTLGRATRSGRAGRKATVRGDIP